MDTIDINSFDADEERFNEYKIVAIDSEGVESFSSEPISVFPKKSIQILEIEDYATKSNLNYSNYSGKGFIEINKSENREIKIPVYIIRKGKYLIDFRYSNGTGPWNTDNNCAIRSLYVNDNYKGVLVFPQRGTGEWSDWGFSNASIVILNKGKNELRIAFKEWNLNMDGTINDAMLDYVRLVRLDQKIYE